MVDVVAADGAVAAEGKVAAGPAAVTRLTLNDAPATSTVPDGSKCVARMGGNRRVAVRTAQDSIRRGVSLYTAPFDPAVKFRIFVQAHTSQRGLLRRRS